MAVPERHPTDRMTISYGKRFLICSVVYAIVVAALTYMIFESFPHAGTGLLSLLSMAGSPAMLLSGLVYVMFGRARRLRIRHPVLIPIHFYVSNFAIIFGLVISSLDSLSNNIPLTAVEALPVVLYLAASGVFVVNLWRSLQSDPA